MPPASSEIGRDTCEWCDAAVIWLPMVNGSGVFAYDARSVPVGELDPVEAYAVTRRGVVSLAGVVHPPPVGVRRHACIELGQERRTHRGPVPRRPGAIPAGEIRPASGQPSGDWLGRTLRQSSFSVQPISPSGDQYAR